MQYKEVVVLEIGQNLVKVARTVFSGKKIKNLSLDVVRTPPHGEFLQAEKVLSKYGGGGKKRKIIICLPRNLFVTRYIELPSEDEHEIREMLPFQLSKNLPHSLEDILYDFLVVGKKGGLSRLLVFILQIKRIEGLLEYLKRHKNLLVDITISSAGLYSWIRLQRPFLRKKEGRNFILLDIDKDFAELIVVQGNFMQFSRSFGYASPSEFIQETQKTLIALRKEFPEARLDSALLTGGASLQHVPQQELGELLGACPVFTLGSLDNIACKRKIKEACSNSDSSYSHLIGLSLEQEGLLVVFLSHSLKEKKKTVSRRKRIKDVIFVCVEAVLILSLLFINSYHRKRLHLSWLDERLQDLKLKTKELDLALEKIRVIEKESKNKKFFSEILSALPSFVPEGLSLSSLDFDDDQTFSMRGYAKKRSEVVDMSASLNKSIFFKDTKIAYMTTRTQRGSVLVEFRITGNLKKSR